jgi:hypothetical protein
MKLTKFTPFEEIAKADDTIVDLQNHKLKTSIRYTGS